MKLKMPLLSLYHYSCYKNLHWNLFIYLYYLTRMTITCFLLNSNCLSCARSVVSSLSSSETMCQLNERAQLPCQWDTHVYIINPVAPTLDLNPVNYKICIEIQQRVCLRKIHCEQTNMMLWHWLAWLWGLSNATDEWCKRLWVCVHVKGRLF